MARAPPLLLSATRSFCVVHNASLMTGSSFSSGIQQQQQHLLQRTHSMRACWKHSGSKMGHHLIRLDEIAHEKNHEQAVEKRKKVKEKNAARKGKGHSPLTESSTSNESTNRMEKEDYDDHGEGEEEEDGTVLPDPKQVRDRMHQIVARFERSLKSIRGGEPTVELFDDVLVEAYGSNTSLQSVAQVVISSPTVALATCFDPAVAKSVSTAIRNQLQLNPSVEEGGVVKIPLPRVSLESRQQTCSALNKRAESFRQRIRRIRRNVLYVVKQGVAGKLEGIPKDDAFRVQKEIEATTDQVIVELNQIAEKKHNSIMSV
jgi:ribosome recycling factor